MQYKWQFKQDKSRNFGIHEIIRLDGDIQEPVTVIIYNYSKTGDKQLFPDLFYSDDWDEGRRCDVISDDVQFCIRLWKQLGLEKEHGPFHPRHIEHDTDRSPIIYRNTMENVMNRKFGCGHSQFMDTIEESSPHSEVIPLTFDISESDESIYNKIANGIIKANCFRCCSRYLDWISL
jgi:hypothetical protein